MSVYFETRGPAEPVGAPGARRRLALGSLLDRASAPFVDAGRSLIVSGFWRSGTTWLLHAFAGLLQAKAIFEPLHWQVSEMTPVFVGSRVPRDLPAPNAFMPFERSGPADRRSPLLAVLHGACRGSLASPWVRNLQNRPGLAEALRRRVVVKSVRLALSLPAVQAGLPNPILHVYRDPRAVVASGLYKTRRMWHNWDDFSLVRHLLEIEDGRAVYFLAWQAEIRRLERQPLGMRLAAYWALTERYLQDASWMSGRPGLVFAAYETLARNPAESLPRTLERLGLAAAAGPEGSWRRDSPSTMLAGQSRDQKLHGWRRLMPAAEQADIAALAADFGLEDRLAE